VPLPKPSTKTNWAVGNVDFANRVIEPTASKKKTAWLDDEEPPAPIFNWLFWIIHEWQQYFESVTDETDTRYDIIVGSGPAATHATLALALADGAYSTDVTVRIDDSASIDTTISLTKARWKIEFKPGVVYTKGAATKCFSFEAEGIVLEFGRLVGWTVGGDIAITQLVGAEYCYIRGTRFGPSTIEEVNQDAVPAGKKGPVSDTITEV